MTFFPRPPTLPRLAVAEALDSSTEGVDDGSVGGANNDSVTKSKFDNLYGCCETHYKTSILAT